MTFIKKLKKKIKPEKLQDESSTNIEIDPSWKSFNIKIITICKISSDSWGYFKSLKSIHNLDPILSCILARVILTFSNNKKNETALLRQITQKSWSSLSSYTYIEVQWPSYAIRPFFFLCFILFCNIYQPLMCSCFKQLDTYYTFTFFFNTIKYIQ